MTFVRSADKPSIGVSEIMKEMTIERAIEILHPDTTADAIAEIEYYAGFGGKQAVLREIDKACLLACDVMEKYLGKKESYISQIRWERDIAISQLNDYGVQFGEQADCVRVVRCKNCIHSEEYTDIVVWCNEFKTVKGIDGFCSAGESR